MNRKVGFSLLMIVAVVAVTATATWAYFAANDDSGKATVSTARIGIGETAGFDLAYTNILPGETMEDLFSVKNTGNRAADFYAQMVGWTGDEGSGSYMNFCTGSLGDNAIRVTIDEVDSGGSFVKRWVDNVKICNLYPGHANSTIVKIGDDVTTGVRKFYRVRVTLNAAAGNEYMDKWNKDTVNLIAVQYDGPAPRPDLDSYYSAWPADTGVDDDPNY